MERVNVGFIGTGAVGGTLARAFAGAGVPVVAVSSRSIGRATALASDIPGCTAYPDGQSVLNDSDLVFLTVPDGAIQSVCDELEWTSDTSAVHCSGAWSRDLLSSAADAGAQVGACHPFQTFTGVGDASRTLAGCMFGVEADEPLSATLDGLVRRLGGWTVPVRPDDRASYHLAGVVASNYLVTLAAVATDLLRDIGLSRDDALRGVLPILHGTVTNLDAIGLPDALTGPIVRGDSGTVGRHLSTISDRHPELHALYSAMGQRTLALARERGKLSDEDVQMLESLFEEYTPG